MDVRPYTPDDRAAFERIWRECGWIDDDGEAAVIDGFVDGALAWVACPDGEAESATTVHMGTMRHTGTDLPLAVVSSVTTSRVGRRQGLARAGLRRALRDAADQGAVVSVLGMFEQGFYDTVGFGTGAEMVFLRIDPASLPADLPYRTPVRISVDDHEEFAALLAERARGHGGVSIPSVPLRRAEMSWSEGGFGLGYRDAEGRLTHGVWCSAKGEHGPYRVKAWAWRTTEQLRELLGALRSLGDQVRWLVLPEPWCMQLQVLIDHPSRQWLRTKGTENHFKIDADAWWQARILDLPAAVAAVSAVEALSCNLRISDPLAEHGVDGVAGDWVLELGRSSSVERGHDPGRPTLTTDVNSLTRLWLGVRAPSTLATTDPIDCPPELLAALDAALLLPRPDVGMDF